MKNPRTISIQDHPIVIGIINENDYINITQLAAAANDDDDGAAQIVSNWLRTRSTMDFLAAWEGLEGDGNFQLDVYKEYAADSSKPSFTMSPQKWVDNTRAIGINVKRGRGGGIYAHKDIALEFCTWLDPIFKLLVLKEFQRLKEEEGRRLSQDWSLKRKLAKINYRIHTDAIRDIIIANLPSSRPKSRDGLIYASEADLINKVIFGMTAAEWRAKNPTAPTKDNIRDYASMEQLTVLSNMEVLNASLIEDGHTNQSDRLAYLAPKAVSQLISLSGTKAANKLREAVKPLDIASKKETDEQDARDITKQLPAAIKKLPSLSDLKNLLDETEEEEVNPPE